MPSSEGLPAVQPAIPLDYRNILDTLADPVVVADKSSRIIYANHAIEPLLGWQSGQLIGEPLITIIPPRFRSIHESSFERYMRTGVPRIIGYPIRVPALARDGTEVDIELALSSLVLPGDTRLVVASLRDLRERVELERQLQVTRYLRAVTRAASQLTSLLDLDRVLETVVDSLVADFEAALARIWLYDRAQDMLHLRASAGLSEEVANSSRAHIDVRTYPYKLGEVARTRRPLIRNGLLGDPQFDQEWVRQEQIESVGIFPLVYGEELLGVTAYFSRKSLKDEVIEALSTFITITTTAIHDVRLFQEEQHYLTQAVTAELRSTFLARAGEVLGSSLDYPTTLSNVAHLAVTSLADWCIVDVVEPDGEVRRVATEHVDPEWLAFAREFEERFSTSGRRTAAVMRVIESGQPVMVSRIQPEQIEATARGAEHLAMMRKLAPLSYMCVPLSIHDRVLGAITFLTTETSGRIYTEADLTLAEELARRAAIAVDNARLYRELQEAIRVRDEFLSSVSHDLKNPLSSIKVRAQLLQRRAKRLSGEHAAQVVEGLENIDRTAEKMTRLIDDLVDLVHLRIGRALTLRREEVDIGDLTEQVVAEQRDAYPGRSIRLEREPGDLHSSVDTARLDRVLVNLISNAVKYSPDGEGVVVTVRREERDGASVATISVTDRGIGIPPEDLPHVFERFYRGSNAASFAGTGIGLAGALQIVEQHGGTMTAQSEPGGETTFEVRLPLEA